MTPICHLRDEIMGLLPGYENIRSPTEGLCSFYTCVYEGVCTCEGMCEICGIKYRTLTVLTETVQDTTTVTLYKLARIIQHYSICQINCSKDKRVNKCTHLRKQFLFFIFQRLFSQLP